MIVYKDRVRLLDVEVDGYNDKTVVFDEQIKALFHLGSSVMSAPYSDQIIADAHVYLDPKSVHLKSRAYRLEGLYIIANVFGADDSTSWYRIESVVVGQRKLLANNVDNVHCFLKKVEAVAELPEES